MRRCLATIPLMAMCLAAFLLSSGTAFAACTYGACFGAIATGPLGAVGAATYRATGPDAEVAALRRCGARCARVEVFHSGCAVLATDTERREWYGFGATRQMAVSEAMGACEAASARCQVRLRLCSR